MLNNMNVIIRPVVTEKSMNIVSNNKFTFIVSIHANKKDIKKSVEKQFNVHVISISTSVVKGKSSRTGKKRIEHLQSAVKKAVVAIQKGEKIGLFEASQ